MANSKPVKVGKVPEEALRRAPNLDREQHIIIRRDNPPMPEDEDLDDGPDIDYETGSYRPATYKTAGGLKRRDW